MAPALEVADLHVRFGSRVALHDVALRADAGELLALVGPNGAGKSTLLRAILGLVPSRGRVALHGEAATRPRRLRAGYLAQRAEAALDFPITVAQVVACGRRPFRRLGARPGAADRAAVARALATVGLEQLGDRAIGTLSGGQAQRTLIARALAQEADVLLLDEPFDGLDPAAAADLMALLERLATGGRTIVVATHDLALVRARFRRCAVLNGRIVADGPPAHVLRAAVLEAAFLGRSGAWTG